jgi:hypothetical protein
MARQSEKFKRNKDKAIAALLSKPSIAEAAKSVGIGQRTLWRWLKDPEFKEQYRIARSNVVIQAVAQIQSSLTEAIKTLRDVMKDVESPSSAKVSAARAVIDMSLKAVEIEDLQVRIEKLENVVETKNREEK